MRFLFFGLLALLCLPLQAQSWQERLAQPPAGSQVALYVQPLGQGQLQVAHNADLLLPPASTQKLFTALAAELALGDDFRFDTALEGLGHQQGNSWQGDLRLRFSGAPDLDRPQLVSLLRALKDKGITRIQGDLLLDGSAFGGYERGPGWPWDNLAVCYSAPASSLTLDHNCVAASLSLENQGTRFYVPPHQPVSVTSKVAAVSLEEQQRRQCGLMVDRGPANHYHLHGCVTDQRRLWPLNFAVNDTGAYVQGVLDQELGRQGLRLSGKIRRQDRAKGQWQPLAVLHSKPLGKLLAHMLADSDNLYADNIAKTLGRQSGLAGTFALGARAVRTTLKDKAGITLAPATLVDGSGLSRDNLVSARDLGAVLAFLAAHTELASYQGLPLAGISGTLKYRHSLTRPPLKGNVRAKSGTLNGSSNLAGYFTAASGQRYLFALMTFGLAPGSDEEAAQRQLTDFERELLNALYQAG